MEALILSCVSIAIVHSLAPDHWIPFSVLARSQNWKSNKLFLIVFISGVAHILSSLILGLIGLVFGVALERLSLIETKKSLIAGWLIIGFGIAYAIWGLKKVKEKHFDLTKNQILTFWSLFLIFIFGPCEPLIPLMFLSYSYGIKGIITISILFSFFTISMMEILTFLSLRGIKLIPVQRIERWSHVSAGIIIIIIGIGIVFLRI
ncbi:MAG: hypothetical protein AB1410_01395 [Acidobacteriota bacterium]